MQVHVLSLRLLVILLTVQLEAKAVILAFMKLWASIGLYILVRHTVNISSILLA